jgi:hypothetical protein
MPECEAAHDNPDIRAKLLLPILGQTIRGVEHMLGIRFLGSEAYRRCVTGSNRPEDIPLPFCLERPLFFKRAPSFAGLIAALSKLLRFSQTKYTTPSLMYPNPKRKPCSKRHEARSLIVRGGAATSCASIP